MAGRRLVAIMLTSLTFVACTGGETEDVEVVRLPHACELLSTVDHEQLVGIETDREQRTEESNDQFNVEITQCDHFGEDMSQRFSLVVRQEFSDRKLEPGAKQLEAMRVKLDEFAQDGLEWRRVEGLGEAAAWNGTANQLTIYQDKAHTTLAFSVYGTDNDFERALELARATLDASPYEAGAAASGEGAASVTSNNSSSPDVAAQE